jgi:dinuclear metal center YbgI/SA1388 family protein
MTVKEITKAIEDYAPLYLQESWDNAGMQVGDMDSEVKGILLCTDVREEIVDEAIERGANMIISHHPLLFRGLKKIVGRSYQERIVAKAIKNDICIYCAHTNLDSALGGVNFKMAEKLGLIDVQLLSPRTVSIGGRQVKAGNAVVGYLPVGEDSLAFLQRVKQAFHVEALQHNQLLERPIESVVICGGAGDFALDDALAAEADAFLTGEMHYHTWFGHEQQIQIAVLGHYESEQFTREIFRNIIEDVAPTLPVYDTEVNTNPIRIL